jgi:uncharacterized surface protein with fasciclin (FAS1) repeats
MRPAIVLLLSALLALPAVACGDDDDDDQASEAMEDLATATPTTAATEAGNGGEGATVIEILREDGRFTTLVQIVEAGEVVSGPPGAQMVIGTIAEIMDQPGWDHTLFAPTDDAFASLDEAEVEALLEPDAATTFIRLYLLDRIFPSEDFVSGEATTIAGTPVTMTVDGDSVLYGGASVVETDIEASNGLIHVIDGVFLP